MYYIRTYPGGLKFFDTWLGLQDRGSDQDGLNTLVRCEKLDRWQTTSCTATGSGPFPLVCGEDFQRLALGCC